MNLSNVVFGGSNYHLKKSTGPPGVVRRSLTANLVVLSLIPARSHTLMEIDHEIFSMSFSSFGRFKKGCCQLQAKVCTQSTG